VSGRITEQVKCWEMQEHPINYWKTGITGDIAPRTAMHKPIHWCELNNSVCPSITRRAALHTCEMLHNCGNIHEEDQREDRRPFYRAQMTVRHMALMSDFNPPRAIFILITFNYIHFILFEPQSTWIQINVGLNRLYGSLPGPIICKHEPP
jgi:hypothetical protein